MRRQVIISLLVAFVPAMSRAQNIRLDPNVEDIVRARLQVDGALTYDHLDRLTAFVIDQRRIKTLVGLDAARNLVSLRITNCDIEDLNSIRGLTGLKELHIRNCRIRDISPLANLSDLSHLSLTHNEIEDLAPLSSCAELAWLDLRHNEIDSLSPLSTLYNLVRVDVRGNPLGSRWLKIEISEINGNNPNVDVRFGPCSDMGDPNDIKGRLSAKAALADFALFAPWHYVADRPHLPMVSPLVSNALLLLRQAHDREYLADVALVLVRYASDILARRHYGTLLNSDNPHPIVAQFLSEVPKNELGGDEVTTTAIAYWVRKNRTVLAPSLVLDAHVKMYHRLQIELSQKWLRELRQVDPPN